MKKKTYMVAIQRTFKVSGLVFYEALTTSAKAAVKEAKAHYKKHKIEIDEEIEEDAKETGGIGDAGEAEIYSIGMASQYHSDAECKLCKKSKEAA
jgi:hypothetical protein